VFSVQKHFNKKKILVRGNKRKKSGKRGDEAMLDFNLSKTKNEITSLMSTFCL